MTNKRKSMNAGDDHAYKLRRCAAADSSAIKGFQGCCPDKFCLWGPINPACKNWFSYLWYTESTIKKEEKKSKYIDKSFSIIHEYCWHIVDYIFENLTGLLIIINGLG